MLCGKRSQRKKAMLQGNYAQACDMSLRRNKSYGAVKINELKRVALRSQAEIYIKFVKY